MVKKTLILMVAAALGGGTAAGLSACGEDREGEVEFQTETTGTGTAGSTETAPSNETAPSTETEAETTTAP
jgi:hypothetical protein